MTTAGPTRSTAAPFRNVHYILLLLIPALGLAFAKKYFQGLTFSEKPVTALIHVHAALMMLWIIMLFAQAWFIRTKRFQWHRIVGRSSFVVAPLIIVSGLLVAHDSLNQNPGGIAPEIAQLEATTWGQIVPFGVLWALAIAYRRRTPLHVRYMISTIFAISTAVSARIIFDWGPAQNLDFMMAANGAVLSALLLTLIALDWRRGIKASPYWVVTAFVALMHIGYFTFAKSEGWAAFVQWFADLPL